MKKLPTIEITELFLVKADWNRTFVGQIIRKTDEDGLSIILGCVIVNEGKIWSKAETQDELGNFLDDICTLKLDHNLHGDKGQRRYFCPRTTVNFNNNGVEEHHYSKKSAIRVDDWNISETFLN